MNRENRLFLTKDKLKFYLYRNIKSKLFTLLTFKKLCKYMITWMIDYTNREKTNQYF